MEITGVMHVHSTYSYDGKESLSSLREFFLARGVRFCFSTEHADEMTKEKASAFIAECEALSDEQFVFIPGFEVPYKDAHILMLGSRTFLAQKADASILARWSSESALCVLAHPVRNTFTLDAAMKESIDGVEIWNQQYEGKRVPRPRSVKLLRALQEKHPDLKATGGLDLHRKDHFGAPLFFVKIPALSEADVVQALFDGAYRFGSDHVSVSSLGTYAQEGSFGTSLQSFFSILLITAGKRTNAFLALFGLRAPKKLKAMIRSRV
jgi:hypothetical protein